MTAPPLYVANEGSASVSVINTRTNRVVRDLPAGEYPVAVAVTPDGGSVYVANEANATVSVISTRTGKDHRDHPDRRRPVRRDSRADGQRAYVAVLGPGNVSAINTQTNDIAGTVNVGPPATDPFDIAVTPTAVYVASQAAGTVTVMDPSSLKITATITVGNSPYGVAVGP